MKKYKILVTGGAGYIGSVLVTKLLELKHHVTVIDKMIYNKKALNHLFHYKNFNLIIGDSNNDRILRKNIKNKNFIIPLAAIVGASSCEKNKKKAIDVNLKAIKKIVKLSSNEQKIIFLNTNSGYGIKKKQRIYNEKSPLTPISLYGRTKNDAEKIITKRKNFVTFRLASVFGYSYRMRDELLLHFLVYEALKKKKINLFEPFFKRNFIHISDVINAIFFAINNFSKLKNNIYNLGINNGTITKINLVKKIKKKVRKLNIKIIKNKKDPDQRNYIVSNRKIEKKGFKALYSLEDGIEELANIYNLEKINLKTF